MSGWTTVTVESNSEEDAEKLRTLFNEAAQDKYGGANNGDGTRIEALIRGYGSGKSEYILRDNTDCWDTAVVMECNDTTDSGSGTVYRSNGFSMGPVDYMNGAELAHGYDVSSYLEEYISGNVYMR